MSPRYHVRVNEYGQHQVYLTTNGVDHRDVGPPFATPRGAIDYSATLQKQADEAAAALPAEETD